MVTAHAQRASLASPENEAYFIKRCGYLLSGEFNKGIWRILVMAVLTFLGTGGDAYTVGRQLLGAGGIVVELSGNQFHLDPGPGSLQAAKECSIDVRRTVAVLVSHNHLNHAHDLNAVLSAMTYGGLDPRGVVLAADSVVEGLGARLHPRDARFAEKVLAVSDSSRVGINDVDVHITPALHSDSSAVGFVLSSGRERIGYTGDTGLSSEVAEAFVGVDTLIACVSRTDENADVHHLSPSSVVELANTVNPRTLVLTHFDQQLLKRDVRNLGRLVSQQVDCHVVVASDGARVDTSMYR